MRREVKPRTKNELVEGIKYFGRLWISTSATSTYIRHLPKVLPKIIELNGAATGY